MRAQEEIQDQAPQNEGTADRRTNSSVSNGNESQTPAINTPKGGGAISSIGEKFQANPVTGTGSMSVPVALSPGRNGFTPQLALSYDSGNGNTEFGMGWNVGIPSISRKTQKGLPKYQDAEESDIFLLAGSEDLIPKLEDNGGTWKEVITSQGGFNVKQYRPRIEGLHAKIEKHTEIATGIVHWEVTTKDNIRSVYGRSSTSRVYDPADDTKIYMWMLEHTYDEKGNIILYEYKRENTDGIDTGLLSEKNRLKKNDAFNKLYLKAVKYTPHTKFDPLDSNYFNTVKWHFQLILDYGEHDLLTPTTAEINDWSVRQDPFSSYRAGFEIRTYRLCRRLLMFHHFDGSDLGANPYLVKSTEITHDENAIASRITSIKHVCHKLNETPLGNEHEYPAVDFTYTEASIDTNIYQHGIEDLENLPNGVDGSQYRWTDLHGEGLSGVLIEDQNAWYFKKNLGDENYYKDLPANQTPAPEARLGAVTQVLERPSLAGGQQLTDIDGNGTPDLVVYSDTISGYYEKNKEGGWENFRAFESNPNINWGDPDLRRIDINGDGFADLLITQDNCFVCYPSQAEKGFGPSYETLKSFEEEDGPKIVFSDADQSVYLADMSGDGLTDIVRIKNGSVCYWPNKGYGLFGAKVSLDNAPWFDYEDTFNQQRIRLADVDGSGTTDIIYIANDCVKYFPNQSGNAFGEEILINQRLPTHNLANIATIDILGNGTQCLVWSSPVEADHPPAMKYIDLMGGIKPYLLTEVNNNMGSVSKMKYVPSTKFYLRDERNGTPWITKLPFPVLVVERVELWDEVNRNRFVSKYAYHHGYFDGVEREFRGFGMVEQWDTESFTDFEGEGLFPPGYNASDETLHVPPIYTKSWFHLGFYQEGEKILDQYRKEYWDGDADAFTIEGDSRIRGNDGTVVDLNAAELREAARALKGSPLRQEVYSQDGSPVETNPYVVTENTYEVKLVQPVALRGPQGDRRRDRDYASFQTIPADSISYQYERNPADPRISHQLTVNTDEYGQVLKAAAIVYPRRSSIGHAQQDEIKITSQENVLINEPENVLFYRLGVPQASKSYEITGISLPSDFYDADLDVREASRSAWFDSLKVILKDESNAFSEISFEIAPTTGLQKRLLDHSQIRYYDEVLSATPLAEGLVASHALPFETYQLALTAGQIANTLNDNGVTRVDTALLTEGKYVDHLSDGDYWIPSGKTAFDTSNFYLPTTQTDPFGNQTSFEFDSYHLLLIKTTDALGNEVQAQYDYRLLQPKLVTDPNGNRQEFEFDVRGMVTKLAVMGKVGDSDGDTLAAPTSEFTYDLFEWSTNQKPNYAYSKSRETHGAGITSFIESYAYSNGLGQVIMTKNKVANGFAYGRDANGDLLREGDGSLSAPIEIISPNQRWIGSGRTILDNKGNPVKQYEPYFSSTHEYESEAELVEYGVTPIIRYDPLGRAIRTELPNDSLTRVEFSPWEQKNYDQNDTVKSSLWYVNRNGAANEGQTNAPTNKDERAAWLAAKHDNTPQVIHLDVLGRPFVTIDRLTDTGTIDGVDFYTMTTELDIQGNPLSITDAKGRTSFTYTYGLLNQPLKTTHLDNGTRYAISDVAGNPLRAWDDRSQQFRFVYDQLLRPTKTYLIDNWSHPEPAEGYNESLISLTVYGESLIGQPELVEGNLRGQVHLTFDSAGMVKNTAFDFKGNPLATERQMAITYQTSPDWSALDDFTDVATLLSDAASLLSTEVFSQSTTYDALNRPVTMTKPDSSVVTPGYDDGGQLETLSTNLRGAGTATDFVTAIKYNERGQRQSITYGNGAHTTYEYDAKTFRLTRLKTTRNTGTNNLQDLNYTYDPVGNIVEQIDNAQKTIFFDNTEIDPIGKYEYDALYRLIEAQGRELIGLATPGHSDIGINVLPENTAALEDYTQKYVYDELGNIERMIHEANSGNWTRHYHYGFNSGGDANNNFLLGTSNSASPAVTNHYTYDAHGNMTAMPHLAAMTWDYADRLQSADLGGGGDVYYTYDAGGDRVRKVIVNGNITEERIYLGDYEVYRKTVSGTLDTERETLHISDDTGRIALVDTLTVDGGSAVSTPAPLIRYQMSNHLGSATLELDATAAVISYEEYHPFGTTAYRSGRNSAETSLKRYRYVGKERDDETGLYYYGARYYAAWLARFVSVDPLKDKYPQLASYQYAGNDPVGDVDIDGLEGTTTEDRSGGQTHTTQKGDTYSGLAKQYGTTVDNLRELNGYDDTKIPIGVDLKISGGSTSSTLPSVSINLELRQTTEHQAGAPVLQPLGPPIPWEVYRNPNPVPPASSGWSVAARITARVIGTIGLILMPLPAGGPGSVRPQPQTKPRSLSDEEIEEIDLMLQQGFDQLAEARAESDHEEEKERKYNIHHVIPNAVRSGKKTPENILLFGALAQEGGFDFDNETNLIALPQFSIKTGLGVHTNHPNYNEHIFNLINSVVTELGGFENLTPESAAGIATGIQSITRPEIEATRDFIDVTIGLNLNIYYGIHKLGKPLKY
ncbi:MAG: AHH domain-containing protein [Cyclobacteriaceae bacterium]